MHASIVWRLFLRCLYVICLCLQLHSIIYTLTYFTCFFSWSILLFLSTTKNESILDSLINNIIPKLIRKLSGAYILSHVIGIFWAGCAKQFHPRHVLQWHPCPGAANNHRRCPVQWLLQTQVCPPVLRNLRNLRECIKHGMLMICLVQAISDTFHLPRSDEECRCRCYLREAKAW
jgi:hypothetical protein